MENHLFQSDNNRNSVLPKFVFKYCHPQGIKITDGYPVLVDLTTFDPPCRFCGEKSNGTEMDSLEYICSCYLPAHLKCLQKELDRLYQEKGRAPGSCRTCTNGWIPMVYGGIVSIDIAPDTMVDRIKRLGRSKPRRSISPSKVEIPDYEDVSYIYSMYSNLGDWAISSYAILLRQYRESQKQP